MGLAEITTIVHARQSIALFMWFTASAHAYFIQLISLNQ